MMPTTALILAGGKGTRLQPVVSDLPKPLAPVAGRPFLSWQLDHLVTQGMQKVILSIGYLPDLFLEQIGESWKGMPIKYVREDVPLGTGGAIRWACEQFEDDQFWVLNGDTYTDFDLSGMWEFHQASQASCTLALKQMMDFDRYGTVQIDSQGCILGFKEKMAVDAGLINAGVYVMNRRLILAEPSGVAFSFETEVLEKLAGQGHLAGLPVAGHFLDIGIPDDYQTAQSAIPAWMSPSIEPVQPVPDTSWTLFLDRDGVINERIVGDYIRHPDQFHFLPGVPEALQVLRTLFGNIVIVTNQQGIGRELMTSEDLDRVHQLMVSSLDELGVKLDGIYFCPSLASEHPVCRKPLPGMALQALVDHPEIQFAKSILIGDSASDIAFGARLGMYTIRIGDADSQANLVVESLAVAAACLKED